jgi:hypothetical protein
MIVVAGLGVRVVIDGLHLPLGVLECHLFILLLLKIQFLFALPLARRCTFLVRLLLLLWNCSTSFLISRHSLVL